MFFGNCYVVKEKCEFEKFDFVTKSFKKYLMRFKIQKKGEISRLDKVYNIEFAGICK